MIIRHGSAESAAYLLQNKDAAKVYGVNAARVVGAPLIAESPLSLECKVTEIIPLGTHHMILADIVAVDVDEALVDGEGKLHLDRADLAAYAHGEYFALGKKLGSFGYSVRKKKNRRK